MIIATVLSAIPCASVARLVQMAQPQITDVTTQAIHHRMMGPRWRS